MCAWRIWRACIVWHALYGVHALHALHALRGVHGTHDMYGVHGVRRSGLAVSIVLPTLCFGRAFTCEVCVRDACVFVRDCVSVAICSFRRTMMDVHTITRRCRYYAQCDSMLPVLCIVGLCEDVRGKCVAVHKGVCLCV